MSVLSSCHLWLIVCSGLCLVLSRRLQTLLYWRVYWPLKEVVVSHLSKKMSLDTNCLNNYYLGINFPLVGKRLKWLGATQSQVSLEETQLISLRPQSGTGRLAFVTVDHAVLLERVEETWLLGGSSQIWPGYHPEGDAGLGRLLLSIVEFVMGSHRFLVLGRAYLGILCKVLPIVTWCPPCFFINSVRWTLEKIMGRMKASKLNLWPDKTEVLVVNDKTKHELSQPLQKGLHWSSKFMASECFCILAYD